MFSYLSQEAGKDKHALALFLAIQSILCVTLASHQPLWALFSNPVLKSLIFYIDGSDLMMQIFAIKKFNSVLYLQGIWLSSSAGTVHCYCKQNSGKTERGTERVRGPLI